MKSMSTICYKCPVIVLNHNYHYSALTRTLEGCLCFISLVDKNVSLLPSLKLFKKSAVTCGTHKAFLDFEPRLSSLPIFTHI